MEGVKIMLPLSNEISEDDSLSDSTDNIAFEVI